MRVRRRSGPRTSNVPTKTSSTDQGEGNEFRWLSKILHKKVHITRVLPELQIGIKIGLGIPLLKDADHVWIGCIRQHIKLNASCCGMRHREAIVRLKELNNTLTGPDLHLEKKQFARRQTSANR